MSNSSSMTPVATPMTGHMNTLFKKPEDRVVDDQLATSIRQNPLHRVGTLGREQFEKNNQMTLEVRFKIYTDMEVDINTPIQSTPKVGASKKSVKADKLNFINSKAINSGLLEFKICPFGKSLDDFKDLVAGACEEYEGGMKKLILNSVFSPGLKWKTTVGRFKVVLDNAVQWQSFVTALEKSTKKNGIVSIENDNMQVKVKVGNKASESATKKLIAATNGEGAEDQESEESKNKRELNTVANQIFSQHAIGKYAGGPGTILTTPWDPNYRVMAKIATVHIPPNTAEFQYEIEKNRWIHPDMGVDDWVGLQLKGSSRQSRSMNHVSQSIRHAQAGGSSLNTNLPGDKNHCVSKSISAPDIKPDLMNIGNKRPASISSKIVDIKPDLKKYKVEQEPKMSINEPIYVSSDFESDWNSNSESSSIEIEMPPPSTSNSVEFELFLADCNVVFDDVNTRTLLREAGILAWTDLIPSVQLTETSLTSKGIDRQIANLLMAEAQARYLKCKRLCQHSNNQAGY
ncbi:uncharacterized protein MELLADRAFT_85214 [Melampsora larici-populina 98AG31]|uniref:Uncharacterized protein n=1 Tax=Melampsora larici-populina (strain 98AG31 / pathotype 3-4-7) TaxID=747676 RepID=F4RHY4_MELLP|nr:uncharacterized protein MELLADRAFT_85214 [Melampsora larici-populina 98AG31]EGG08050.1 hypothetical protein MELLADRAFT_85214 [Melampsora larici-populina 98AG31]